MSHIDSGNFCLCTKIHSRKKTLQRRWATERLKMRRLRHDFFFFFSLPVFFLFSSERAVNVSLNYSRGVTARALQLPTSTTAEKLSTSASSLSHFVDRFFVTRTLNGSLNDLDKSSEVDRAPTRNCANVHDRLHVQTRARVRHRRCSHKKIYGQRTAAFSPPAPSLIRET